MSNPKPALGRSVFSTAESRRLLDLKDKWLEALEEDAEKGLRPDCAIDGDRYEWAKARLTTIQAIGEIYRILNLTP